VDQVVCGTDCNPDNATEAACPEDDTCTMSAVSRRMIPSTAPSNTVHPIVSVVEMTESVAARAADEAMIS
jgi:hypothetical protein